MQKGSLKRLKTDFGKLLIKMEYSIILSVFDVNFLLLHLEANFAQDNLKSVEV